MKIDMFECVVFILFLFKEFFQMPYMNDDKIKLSHCIIVFLTNEHLYIFKIIMYVNEYWLRNVLRKKKEFGAETFPRHFINCTQFYVR